MEHSELLRYARLGARARIEDLHKEIHRITSQFPGLAATDLAGGSSGTEARGGRRETAAAQAADSGAGALSVSGLPVTKKRTMSAAGRKKIAEAARKRWAEWRKAQGRK